MNEDTLLLTKCYLDPVLWFTEILGFTIKPFHREWIEMLFKHNKIAISAPTGFGKTSIFGIGYPLWLAFFKPRSKSLIIAKTIRTQSANVLEEIKHLIETNPILNKLKPKDTFSEWSKEKITCSNGSQIFYSSYSPNIRGIHVDYLFADEVATYLDDLIYYRDVSTRVDSKKGKIAAVSTPITTTDLLAQLLNNEEYISKVYPAIVDGKSIWPEKYPIKWLNDKKKEIHGANYERNYMCNPRAESANPIFPLSSIEDCYDITRGFSEITEGNQVFAGVDLAISSGPRADYDVYTIIEKVGDLCIIRWAERGKGIPIESKEIRLKQLCEKYKPIRIIIDESNIGHAIIEDLRKEGFPVESQAFNALARNSLLSNLKRLIDTKKLIIPRNKEDPYAMNYTNVLTEELIGFKEQESRLTKIKHLVSDAAHDDTVMSLALACKGSMTSRTFTDYIASGND